MNEESQINYRESTPKQKAPSRLFCWSGGGFPGIDIHTGIWLALEEAGIRPTCNAGTSAGAIMAALNSYLFLAADAEKLVRSLTDEDVRNERFAWKMRIPWIEYFMNPQPIELLLKENLPPNFNNLMKDCFVFATDVRTGESQQFGMAGNLIRAIMASMAISGVYPPVGNMADGGTSANLPLPANWKDFDEIYLLVAKRPLDYPRNGSMLSRLFYNFDLFLEDQMDDEIELARHAASSGPTKIFVIRPAVCSYTGMLRFNHDLIGESYVKSKAIIAGWNGNREEVLSQSAQRARREEQGSEEKATCKHAPYEERRA